MDRGKSARARRPPRDAVRNPRGRPRLCEDEQVDRLRPSLRGHQRAGAARRAGACGAVRLPARDAVDFDRRGARRCGAGFHHPRILDAARRAIARPDAQGRTEQGRGCRGHYRNSLDHDHPARRARARRGERARRFALGCLHGRGDRADRDAHGRLPALGARGESPRSLRHRRGAAARRGVGRPASGGERDTASLFQDRRRAARVVGDHLRLRCQRAPGVAAARAARLPQHLHEARHDLRTRDRDSDPPAGTADARGLVVH